MKLTATTRTAVRRQTSRHLRRAGRLAGVVYGHGVASVPIELDGHEFGRIWHRLGGSALLDLEVDGGRPRKVLIKAVQISPRHHDPVHVDLLAVNMRETLHLEVPLEFGGEAAPVADGVAELIEALRAVTVECLPTDIPETIPVDLALLTEVGAELRVADLALPAGVTMVTGGDELVAKLNPRREMAEVEAPEAAEPAEETGSE